MLKFKLLNDYNLRVQVTHKERELPELFPSGLEPKSC